MRVVTATDLARNFREMLNQVEFKHEELIIVRNNHEVARLIPGPATMSALAAMSDIYCTLAENAGKSWLADSRKTLTKRANRLCNPWDI